MNAYQITESLKAYYIKTSKYCLSNAYIFRSNWESDFFVETKTGYLVEFEVKISRSDYKADAKKVDKHTILKTGMLTFTSYKWSHLLKKTEAIEKTEPQKRPNRFYYVVPENLIQASEVPEYAGLIYIRPNKYHDDRMDILVIKNAPFIHKEKINIREQLCEKFYNYWNAAAFRVKMQDKEISRLNQLLTVKNNIDGQIREGNPAKDQEGLQ